jgi:hypothetical protein
VTCDFYNRAGRKWAEIIPGAPTGGIAPVVAKDLACVVGECMEIVAGYRPPAEYSAKFYR